MDKAMAYLIGLMASDGNLSKDGRHLIFVSKDFEQIKNFLRILKKESPIGIKRGGYLNSTNYYFVQFSDVVLYKLFISIGIFPNKSKLIGEVKVPDTFFGHFLRGLFDGDGFSYSYWDKRWKNSFMLYVGFVSASKAHLYWLQKKILNLLEIKGSIKSAGKSGFQLVFAKKASIELIKSMYFEADKNYLTRKKFKIDEALGIINR